MPANSGLPHDLYTSKNRYVAHDELAVVRRRALARISPFNIIDSPVDDEWARYHSDTRAPRSYYDYYFSGADIKAYVAELGDDPEFGDLPIALLAFNVEQQKQPLYGYWSYTFDAVMRGQRLVSGRIDINVKYPGYFKKLLTAAARKRVENRESLLDPYPAAGGLTEDDANIDKYWGRNLDPAAIVQGQQEFSVHPPFNLVVVFGVQNTSVEPTTNNFDEYSLDAALYSDHNQRLVEGYNPNQPTRYIIEACELTGVNTVYSSDVVVQESYTFFARDLIVPPQNYRPPLPSSPSSATPPQTSAIPPQIPEGFGNR